MPLVVKLKFHTKIDIELYDYNIVFRVIRLLASVRFRNGDELSEPEEAIVDTASPATIIPFSLWKEAEVKFLSHEYFDIHGIGTDEETAVSGRVGEVALVFVDDTNMSPPLETRAYLLDDDSAPLMLGFEDTLTEVNLFMSYKNDLAYLEFEK